MGQTIRGNFSLELTEDSVTGSSVIVVLASNVGIEIQTSEGNGINVKGAEGALILSSEGIVGKLSGGIEVKLGGDDDDVKFSAASLSIELNNTNSPIVQNLRERKIFC